VIYDFLFHEFSTYPCAVSSSLESFAFFGVVINLVTYLVEEMHFGVPAAANTVTTWAGTTCLTPLLGGFIADTYLGRYLTLLFLGFVELLVHCFHPPCVYPVSISAAAPSLRPPPLDAVTGHSIPSKAPRILQVGFLLTALYVIALGKAGYGSCILSLGADQFDEKDQEERRKLSSYFNWFFLVNCIGIFFSIAGLVFVEDKVSWVWGYGVAAGAMALGNVALFSGYSFYRHHAALGSPFTHIARVFVAAIGKRSLPNLPTSGPFQFHDFQGGAHQGRRARHS
jgi:peptide/histidine transporter 3/4